MGREIRKVPADWQMHEQPMFDQSYVEAAAEYSERKTAWDRGERPSYAPLDEYPIGYPFSEWEGDAPDPTYYRPNWPEAKRTHFMMYETCSAGTPISPAFATPEEVAQWCADNGASAFGNQTASYEAWLRVANVGFAPSAVLSGGVLQSGVEAL